MGNFNIPLILKEGKHDRLVSGSQYQQTTH